MLTLDNQKDVMAFMPGRHKQSLFGESGTVENIKWAYTLMMFWCMMFTGVAGTIEDTLSPKVMLHKPTFEPMKVLIH